ncbi:MAG: tRNA (adenosine(37)-N6)-threonylcarbamoyltransferase complex ATPase subunit type 1 TsaE [Hyphomicrobiaceae bacterium]
MSTRFAYQALSEDAVSRLAELVALKLQVGDVIALHGDLGAGKTTFARAFIRAVLADPDAEVPSPTFPIVQPYETPRIKLWHFDLYRLSGPDDLEEVGFHDALANGVTLVEWPDRAEDALPGNRLDISLQPGANSDLRDIVIEAHGPQAAGLERLDCIHSFLAAASLPGSIDAISYLQGDASARAYARIRSGATTFVLMDSPPVPDGPPIHDGLPYSRIAHLAEDVRPFIAIGHALENAGLAVPHIHEADLDNGLLLLEDLGDLSFGRALANGSPQDELWSAAVDVLLALRSSPAPHLLHLPDATTYELSRFDRAALEIELCLILDWYWPEIHGKDAPGDVRQSFLALWSPVLDRLMQEPPGLFLRDFHSPNLFWLPGRTGIGRVGVIDFQDALAEPWALDLVSLLQDARVDVPRDLEHRELARYLDTVESREPDFDRDRFQAVYSAFGAQRNTRLVGLWIRLLRRDAKPGYLQHMSRTWDYLARNLDHPDLARLKAWYDHHFPQAVRDRKIVP